MLGDRALVFLNQRGRDIKLQYNIFTNIMTRMISHVKKYIAYKKITVPPLYVFCVSEEKYGSHGAVNTDWIVAQNSCMRIWYTNYCSRWIKEASVTLHTFWWATIVIAGYVRYKWCAKEPCMCALGHYDVIIIFLLEYSECFITDVVCWRSVWGSVVFIRASDRLFLQRNYLLIVNNNTQILYLLLLN